MSAIHSVHGHFITVNDEGIIGNCDCEDFERRKKEHKGWCKHRLVIALQLNGEIIETIDALSKRLASARTMVEKGDL